MTARSCREYNRPEFSIQFSACSLSVMENRIAAWMLVIEIILEGHPFYLFLVLSGGNYCGDNTEAMTRFELVKKSFADPWL
ncbi:MAG: hypothetical protein WCL42_03300, partial [Chlorobiaceae bacterium]